MSRLEIPEPCLRVGERIDSYLDGDLPPVEHAEVAAHLSSCAECAADFAFGRRVQNTLHTLPAQPCPDRVIERVYARISPRPVTFGERLRAFAWHPALVGAFAVALIAVTALIGQRNPAPEQISQAELVRAEREARWALKYVGLLGERTGRTVKSDVIDERILVPVVRTLERSLERDNSESKREVRNAG